MATDIDWSGCPIEEAGFEVLVTADTFSLMRVHLRSSAARHLQGRFSVKTPQDGVGRR